MCSFLCYAMPSWTIMLIGSQNPHICVFSNCVLFQKEMFFKSAKTSCTTLDWCVRLQEFLLLLLSRQPCHPGLVTSPSPWLLFCCCCRLLQMIIRMDWPLANDHPDGPASCKWSSELAGLLQMIIWMDQPFANDHLDGPASCMIIRMDQPLANDYPDGLAYCK